jgi:hypothetical protein
VRILLHTLLQAQLHLEVFYCTLYCDVFHLLSKAVIRHIQIHSRKKNSYIKNNKYVFLTLMRSQKLQYYGVIKTEKIKIKYFKINLNYCEVL